MTYKKIDTANYPEQFRSKEESLIKKLSKFGVQQLDTFESPRKHYRMRAEFRVWHEGDDLYYIMFNPETRGKNRMDEFLPGSELINRLMKQLIEKLKPNPILRTSFQSTFLQPQRGKQLSLCFIIALDDEWEKEATALRENLKSWRILILLVVLNKNAFCLTTVSSSTSMSEIKPTNRFKPKIALLSPMQELTKR